MNTVGITDVGRMRPANQDTCRFGLFPDGAAWTVVCDGMGGVSGGNIASNLVCNAVAQTFENEYRADMDAQAMRTMMNHAIQLGNEAVLKRAEEEPSLRGMGTTVVAAIASGGVLHVMHVGDSRCYLKSERGVEQITTDHSFVQQLVDRGAITPEEARVHPQRNLITRVVGVHEELECDYGCYNFAPGDTALSCSDGLSSYLESDTLQFFTENYEGEKLAQELVNFANDNGGRDNITVALIENR